MLIGFAFLPFILMLILWHRRIADWRSRFLTASIAWGTCAVVITEMLSVVNAIAPWPICVGWLLCAILLLLWLRWDHAPIESAAGTSAACPEKYVFLPQILLLATVLLVIAWIGPPNNWDAMAYHLPRVMHWMQNRNVEFYPTGCLRQLEMPPGAEYLILHLQLLGGTDRWTDMVQWFAYVGCIIGVSDVARQLGGGARAQILAATFCATLPMACLQSVTAQNDLVSAFWFICFISFVLRICGHQEKAGRWSHFILCGASLGLALVTKSTMYILAAPFGVALAVHVLRRFKSRLGLRFVSLAMIVLAINAPTYFRNDRLTHAFLGSGGFGSVAGQYTNQHPGIGAAASNILRNAGLELAISPPPVARGVENAVRLAHRWMGLDPDNPDTTFESPRYDLVHSVLWNSEDYAPNPFHVILIAAALLTLLFAWPKRNLTAHLYAAGIVSAFVLFCGYLRYQPWNVRLHLPLMIASGALVGVVLERQWKPALSMGVFSLLPLLVAPWIFTNSLHPLVGPNTIFDQPRNDQYFRGRALLWNYLSIVDFAEKHHVKQIGVIGDGNCWEYPLQILLHEQMPDVRIESFPSKYTHRFELIHTRNHGFDPNLKPYLVVKLVEETALGVDYVGS